MTGKDEYNGTSTVDVTSLKAPRYLAHLPGEDDEGEAGGAHMVRVCSGKTLPHALDRIEVRSDGIAPFTVDAIP